MPKHRVIRKDNFAVNLLPVDVIKDRNSQTTGIEKLISLSEIAAAQATLVSPGHDDEVPVYMVGDMHGNALKLLAVLGLTGVVKLNPDTFKAWAELYESTSPATDYFGSIQRYHADKLDEAKAHYKRLVIRPDNFDDQIKRILDRLSWNSNFSGQIILLGDVLHDRGHSDFMTVLLMERMSQKKIHYTYCLGNHDQGVLIRYIWKGMGYSTLDYEGDKFDRQFFNGLMSQKPSDSQSYDYGALSAKQKKQFTKAYEIALKHAKLFEPVSVGDEIVIGSHTLFNPDLLPTISQELKTILALKNTEETRRASPELIEDINRMLQKAIFNKKCWGMLAGTLIEHKSALAKSLMARKSDVAASNEDGYEGLIASFTTGEYRNYYSVYGHDLEGKVDHLGKLNPVTIKQDDTRGSEVFLCLDTLIGRPKSSSWSQVASAWSKPGRSEASLPDAGFYQGDLLICSIKPELKNPDQKLIQSQKAVINGIYAYENWYKSLSQAERSPAYDQDRQIALLMLDDVVSSESPSAVRLVLQDFAMGLYGSRLQQFTAGYADHRHNLLSYLLDSINAAYPPLSLAVKLGSAEAGSHSFTIDYPVMQGVAPENERLATIKKAAFQKMKLIGEKAQAERSGIDVATMRANNARRNAPPSTPGVRRVVESRPDPTIGDDPTPASPPSSPSGLRRGLSSLFNHKKK